MAFLGPDLCPQGCQGRAQQTPFCKRQQRHRTGKGCRCQDLPRMQRKTGSGHVGAFKGFYFQKHGQNNADIWLPILLAGKHTVSKAMPRMQ